MSFRQITTITFIVASLFSAPVAADLRTWPADDLQKVLRTDLPPQSPEKHVLIESCRGEIENGQIAFRSDANLAKLTAEATDLADSEGNRITAPRIRYVGYVHIDKNSDAHYDETGPFDLVARAPVDLPDPLLEDEYIDVKANQTGAVWLTVSIPRETPAGTYEGSVTIKADGRELRTPVAVKVYDVVLPPDMNLKLVNWYHTGPVTSIYGVPLHSEQFFEYVEADAKAMAAHRQSIGYITITDTITAVENEDGDISFDFTNFDRMANIYQKAGLPYLMGSHLAGRNQWKAPDFYALPLPLKKADGSKGRFPAPKDSSERRVFVMTDTFKEYASVFLPALQKHLEEKGWLNIYYQHMADEPVNENADAFERLTTLVKTYAPRIKRTEATRTIFVEGTLEVYVPLLSELHENTAIYKELMLKGSEVWFYTCERPRGVFMNRFIESPLAETRLLHWANYYTHTTGYLHWGYNPTWGKNILTNPGGIHPVGDGYIVYPGLAKLRNHPAAMDRPHSLDSIRYEAMRDGVEDYELLRLLAKKDRQKADDICSMVMYNLTGYTTDPMDVNKARKALLEALQE